MSDPKGPKLELPPELEEELGADDDSAGELSAPLEPDTPIEPEVEVETAPESLAPEAARRIRELEEEIEAIKDRHLRAAAELQNQRRRLLKEQQDQITFANENLVKDLLGTVDNLERALSHAGGAEGEGVDPQNLMDGVALTLRSLMSVLERAGVEVVDAADTKFDPRHHEAMRQVPTRDRDPGSVVEVYQKGYLLKGRLLRPAMVAVASPAPEES